MMNWNGSRCIQDDDAVELFSQEPVEGQAE